MYARKMEPDTLTFDFAEGLVQDNLLLVDRETQSVWSQLDGKAISGSLKEQPMVPVPALQTTWRFWRQQHPSTSAMVLEAEGHPYRYRDWQPGQPRPAAAGGHDTSSLGLGLVLGQGPVFFPFRELARTSLPLRFPDGEREVTVYYRPEAVTAWAEDAEGNMLPGVLAYQKGWQDFNPATRLFSGETSDK